MTPVTFKLMVWIKAQPNIQPFYRIYVDEELFTERTFIWDADSTHIRENIAAILAPGPHVADVRFFNISADQIISSECKLFFPQIDELPLKAKFNPEHCDYSFQFTLD